MDWVVAPSAGDDVRAFVQARASVAPPRTVHADFLATNAFDVMDRLDRLTVPTLVVGSDEDRMTPIKYARFLAQRIPGAQLVVFPECGHYPHVEAEAAFNQTLAEFLASVP
jgi:pimeloyl-ACP methyl ester carboxylesterase